MLGNIAPIDQVIAKSAVFVIVSTRHSPVFDVTGRAVHNFLEK